jgi:ORF6N domain
MPSIPPRRMPKPENLASLIYLLGGEKVLLSEHLAELYAVPVKVLNQAVKRNIDRFPDDFMFQLTRDEADAILRLRSQTGDGSIYSVERMAVAGHSWAHANEGGRPQQHGGRVRAGAAAAQQLAQKSAHGFDGVGGPR